MALETGESDSNNDGESTECFELAMGENVSLFLAKANNDVP